MINFLFNHTPLLYWTQSLWRDEAYSVWIAQGSIFETISKTSGDFNPPLYYLLLKMWMFIFGRSEIALRGMSVFFFLCFLIAVYFFAQKIFKNNRQVYFTTLLMAVNPMLVYFTFELRMYSLLILFATLSMYFFYIKNWKWYIITSVLGLYTQPFMAFLIVSQGVYSLLTNQIKLFVRNAFYMAILYLPWLPTLYQQFKSSGPMWIYPVDANLIFSAMGNMYFGYEGTPGNLWPLMKFTSFLIFLAGIWLWLKDQPFRKKALLFYVWVFIPLFLVLGISLLKPIYVNRYIIFVSIGEVFLISLFINHIKNQGLKNLVYSLVFVVTFLANFILAPSFHRKVDIRKTFIAINPILKEFDLIYAETPLVYYETLYYSPPSSQVFLYNPDDIEPPRYVGSVGMPRSVWKNTLPTFPTRAFIIAEDGKYRIMSLLQ